MPKKRRHLLEKSKGVLFAIICSTNQKIIIIFESVIIGDNDPDRNVVIFRIFVKSLSLSFFKNTIHYHYHYQKMGNDRNPGLKRAQRF